MKSLSHLLLALILALPLCTQTATLGGQVTDDSGAVIPGPKVTAAGTGAPKTATADSTGVYTVSGLTPGTYTVQAPAPELAMTQPARISLGLGTQVLNLTLHVVSLTEKVTVQESAAPSVNTDSSNNASAVVLAGSDLEALSDDPDDLAADLLPQRHPSHRRQQRPRHRFCSVSIAAGTGDPGDQFADACAVHYAIGHLRGAAVTGQCHTCCHLYELSRDTRIPLRRYQCPLPGTYNPAVQNSGVYPLGQPGAASTSSTSRAAVPTASALTPRTLTISPANTAPPRPTCTTGSPWAAPST